MTIRYTQARAEQQLVKNFWGLTAFEGSWGNIGLPTVVRTPEELIEKFGNYMEATEHLYSTEPDWMQAYNFLQYTSNLSVFRYASITNTPTFDGVTSDLTSITGSSHAQIFINSTSHSDSTSVWNEINNGSNIYLKLNDFQISRTVPDFATDQLLFVCGKYAGIRGNDLKVSIANSSTDFSSFYVSAFDSMLVADASSFSVDDTITGDTSTATAVIKQIIGDTIYYDQTSTTDFSVGEGINTATTTITSLTAGDDVENNIPFSELFSRRPRSDEFAIVVTLDDKLMEYQIISFDNTQANYIGDVEMNWIGLEWDQNWTSAQISPVCSVALSFGANTSPSIADSEILIKRGLSPTFTKRFVVGFVSNYPSTIINLIRSRLAPSCLIFHGDSDVTTISGTVSIKNKVWKINPYNDTVTAYEAVGDVCGAVVRKLQNDDFSESIGVPDQSFESILSVEEFSTADQETFATNRQNIVVRLGNDYKLKGNFSDVSDNSIQGLLNIRLLLLYVQLRLTYFLESKLFSPNGFSSELESELEDIRTAVRKYVRNFDYEYEVDGRTVDIRLFEELGVPIDNLRFSIDYKV